jgi:hypothetical protein
MQKRLLEPIAARPARPELGSPAQKFKDTCR